MGETMNEYQNNQLSDKSGQNKPYRTEYSSGKRHVDSLLNSSGVWVNGPRKGDSAEEYLDSLLKNIESDNESD